MARQQIQGVRSNRPNPFLVQSNFPATFPAILLISVVISALLIVLIDLVNSTFTITIIS
jgi:hypothetical protein